MARESLVDGSLSSHAGQVVSALVGTLGEPLRAAVLARQGRVEGGEIRFCCPCPERHENGDAHPSARFNPAKAVWCCDVCSAGGGALDLANLLHVEAIVGADINGVHPPPGVPATWDTRIYAGAWCYRDADGSELGWAVRYNPTRPGDKKEVVPFFKREGDRWKPGAAPKPRPLFGLDILAAQPEARVWVTEGEKCAVAVQRLASVAVTSQGGSSAAGKADWSPLRGRRVIVWPDNDTPGVHYGADVLRLALASGAASVEVLDIAALNLGDGGDVVDWLALHPGATLRDLEALHMTDSTLDTKHLPPARESARSVCSCPRSNASGSRGCGQAASP